MVMKNKLQLSKILVIVVFFIFTISLLLPYQTDYDYDMNPILPNKSGLEDSFYMLYIFFAPLLVLFLLKHFQILRILCLLGAILLFCLVIFIYNINFNDYYKANLGYYLMMLASFIFVIAGTIKVTVPVQRKRITTDILDQF